MARARNTSAITDLKIRMREPLRIEIETAAKQRGVSMNAEINDRLAASFAKERSVGEIFGSREIYGLMRAVASVMDQAGRLAAFLKTRNVEASESWWADAYGYNQAILAANRMLEGFRPVGDPSPPEFPEKQSASELVSMADIAGIIGPAATKTLLMALAEGRSGVEEIDRYGADLRKDLGTLGRQVHIKSGRKDRGQ